MPAQVREQWLSTLACRVAVSILCTRSSSSTPKSDTVFVHPPLDCLLDPEVEGVPEAPVRDRVDLQCQPDRINPTILIFLFNEFEPKIDCRRFRLDCDQSSMNELDRPACCDRLWIS